MAYFSTRLTLQKLGQFSALQLPRNPGGFSSKNELKSAKLSIPNQKWKWLISLSLAAFHLESAADAFPRMKKSCLFSEIPPELQEYALLDFQSALDLTSSLIL